MGWGRVASSLRACPRSPSRRPSRPQSPRRSPRAVRHGRGGALVVDDNVDSAESMAVLLRLYAMTSGLRMTARPLWKRRSPSGPT